MRRERSRVGGGGGAARGWGREVFSERSAPSVSVRYHARDVTMGFCAACLPPRDWLHRLQTARVFSTVSSPPCEWGSMWSASALAGVLDTA